MIVPPKIEWVRAIRDRLEEMLSKPVMTATGDIRWLILRCNDTLGYTERLQEPSARQLVKDLMDFDEEHPGVLADDILTMLRDMEA
jgi:hypothetical protein